jgi:drug/metabolite transporter (DMT)-like permease
VYGLLTAAGFGTADFFVTRASRRIGPFRALYLIQLFGLLALLGVALARREEPPGASIHWLWMVLLSLLSFGGMLCLYRSFTIGALAICSPIAASYAVVTGILAYATGERPPGPALVGAAVLVVGVAIVARGSGAAGAAGLAGVPEALGAALLLGITFWGVDGIVDEMGWLWPVIILRVVMLACALAAVSRQREAHPRPELGTGRFILLAALLDSLALVSLNLGLERTFTTTTAALGSLYSAVAVVLAWLFLRERLARAQWFGIAVILAGVLLVSV